MHSVIGHTVLSWCSRAQHNWGRLVGDQLALGTNTFCNRSYCPGVVGLSTTGVDLVGGQSALGTNAFSAIGHTVLVY